MDPITSALIVVVLFIPSIWTAFVFLPAFCVGLGALVSEKAVYVGVFVGVALALAWLAFALVLFVEQLTVLFRAVFGG
jgi:hypothetical protein